MTGISCATSCSYFCISFFAMSLGLFEIPEKQAWPGPTSRDPNFLREVPRVFLGFVFWNFFWGGGGVYSIPKCKEGL